MTARTALLTLHIAAIASWIGADVLQHVMRHRWAHESAEGQKAWARMQFFLHDKYYAGVAVFVLLTGIGLVQNGHWSWKSHFIWVGFGAIVIGATVGGIIVKAYTQKRIAALDKGDEVAAAAAEKVAVPLEWLLTATVLVTIAAMVSKWGT